MDTIHVKCLAVEVCFFGYTFNPCDKVYFVVTHKIFVTLINYFKFVFKVHFNNSRIIFCLFTISYRLAINSTLLLFPKLTFGATLASILISANSTKSVGLTTLDKTSPISTRCMSLTTTSYNASRVKQISKYKFIRLVE